MNILRVAQYRKIKSFCLFILSLNLFPVSTRRRNDRRFMVVFGFLSIFNPDKYILNVVVSLNQNNFQAKKGLVQPQNQQNIHMTSLSNQKTG